MASTSSCPVLSKGAVFKTPFNTHAIIKRSGLPSIQPKTMEHLQQVQNAMETKIAQYRNVLEMEFRRLEKLRLSKAEMDPAIFDSACGDVEDRCRQIQKDIDSQIVMVELRTAEIKEEWRQTLLDLMEAKEVYALPLSPEARARYFLSDWENMSNYMIEMHRRRVDPLESDDVANGSGLR